MLIRVAVLPSGNGISCINEVSMLSSVSSDMNDYSWVYCLGM